LGAEPLEQAGLFFLLTHAGEGGHACPVTCTAGLIRALRLHGSDELRERFLPPLLETDYDRCQRGAQFLTEEQGGSDVGANLTRAVRDGDAWRLHGEKWFARRRTPPLPSRRPEGARKNARYRLLPRAAHGRGASERFHGSAGSRTSSARALATGEIVFDGAVAHRWALRTASRSPPASPNTALAECGRLGSRDAPRVPRGGGLRA
jgi:alkylation response protein AidB-like acyl-CoA dehydrogenase